MSNLTATSATEPWVTESADEALHLRDEDPIEWRTVLADAHAALRQAVRGVPPGAWQHPTPCTEWSAVQVLRHSATDQLGYAAAITHGPWPEEDPFAPSAEPVEHPERLIAEAMSTARTAFTTVTDDAVAVPTPLPGGPVPPWLAAGACALDAAVHAWDIAVATGQESPLTPELSRALLIVATEIADPLRPYGAYAAPVTADDEAADHPGEDLPDDDASELLRFLGRRPRWQP